MKYKNIFDTHTHSNHSFDGNDSCKELCESLMLKGGIGIAITDHCDIDGDDDFDIFANNQYDDTSAVKEEYCGQITLLQGIELGQGIYQKDKALKIINSHDYDIIIGSIHNLDGMEDFYFLDYKKYDIDGLLTKYFENELELAQWNKTDTLAHLTYPLRYIVEREGVCVDLSKYNDIIYAIFNTLIRNDKALEVNTSGLFMAIDSTLPGIDLIKRYHDMGGRLITVGSDSHYKEKICQGISQGYDILKECGYKEFTVFKNRIPYQMPIE